MTWYYKLTGQGESGPVPFEILLALKEAGELKRSTLVREGDGAWMTAQSVEPLWSAASSLATAEEPPAPPPPAAPPPAEVRSNGSSAGKMDEESTKVLEELQSLDDLDFQIVSEAPEPESLDDLGIRIVDGATDHVGQPSPRPEPTETWTDPSAFDVHHVERSKPKAEDRTQLPDDLKELADNALVGSTPDEPPPAEPLEAVDYTKARPKPKKAKKSTGTETPSGAQATVGWFVRVDGKPHGPSDFEVLKQWAEEGRLLEQDEIQLPGTGVWVPAGSVPTLFENATGAAAAAPPPAPAASPAPATPPAPAPTPAPQETYTPAAGIPATHTPAAGIPATHTPAAGIPAVPEPPAAPPQGTYPPPAQPAAAGPPPGAWTPPKSTAKPKKAKVSRAPSQLGAQISEFFSSLTAGGDGKATHPAAIGLLVLIVLFFAWQYIPFGDNDAGDYEFLAATYAKSVELREAGDSSAWSSFVQEVTPKVQELAETLEKTASAKEPEKQRMLWASRDYLLPILGGEGETSVETENDEKFKTHMEVAKAYIDGNPPEPQEEEDGGDGDEDGEDGEDS